MVFQQNPLQQGVLKAEVHPPRHAQAINRQLEKQVPVLGVKRAIRGGSRNPIFYAQETVSGLQKELCEDLHDQYALFRQETGPLFTKNFRNRNTEQAVKLLTGFSEELYKTFHTARDALRRAIHDLAPRTQVSPNRTASRKPPLTGTTVLSSSSRSCTPEQLQILQQEEQGLVLGLAYWELAHILLFDLYAEHQVPLLIAKWYTRHYLDEFLLYGRQPADKWALVIQLIQLDLKDEALGCLKELAEEEQNIRVVQQGGRNNNYALSPGVMSNGSSGVIINNADKTDTEKDIEVLIEVIQQTLTHKQTFDAVVREGQDPFSGNKDFFLISATERYWQMRAAQQEIARDRLMDVCTEPAKELLSIYAGERVTATSWVQQLLFRYLWQKVEVVPGMSLATAKSIRNLGSDCLQLMEEYAEEEVSDSDVVIQLIFRRNGDGLLQYFANDNESQDVNQAVLAHFAEMLFLTGQLSEEIRHMYMTEYNAFLCRAGLFSESLTYLDPIAHASLIRETFQCKWWPTLTSDERRMEAFERVHADQNVYSVLRQEPSVLASVSWARAHDCVREGKLGLAIYWAVTGGPGDRVSAWFDELLERSDGSTDGAHVVDDVLDCFCTNEIGAGEWRSLDDYLDAEGQLLFDNPIYNAHQPDLVIENSDRQDNYHNNKDQIPPENALPIPPLWVREVSENRDYQLPADWNTSGRLYFFAFWSFVKQKKAHFKDLQKLVQLGLCPPGQINAIRARDLLPYGAEHLTMDEVFDLVTDQCDSEFNDGEFAAYRQAIVMSALSQGIAPRRSKLDL